MSCHLIACGCVFIIQEIKKLHHNQLKKFLFVILNKILKYHIEKKLCSTLKGHKGVKLLGISIGQEIEVHVNLIMRGSFPNSKFDEYICYGVWTHKKTTPVLDRKGKVLNYSLP